MLSTVGLEVMNTANPDLNWKTVTKGRRTKKSTGRSLNTVAKVGNSISPKRVGDFSGSDSDKFGKAVNGQSTSGKFDNVPIKKRRNMLKSSSKPLPAVKEQLPYSSCSSGKRSPSSYSSGKRSAEVRDGKRKVFVCDRAEGGYNCAGDFSGIELLAAAASMAVDDDNANKQDLVAEDHVLQKNSDVTSSATESKLCLKSIESEKSSSNMTVHGANTDSSLVLNESTAVAQQQGRSPEDGVVPKVNRQHWDLNIPMDAWDEPYDDSIAENNPTAMDNNMHMEERQKSSKDDIFVPGCRGDEASNLKMEETSIIPDRTCVESHTLEKGFRKPPKNSYSDAARETPDLVTKVDADGWNSNKVLRSDALMEISSHVMKEDAINTNPLIKLLPSTMSMSEEKLNILSATAATMQDEDCSSNESELERVTASDQMQTKMQDVTVDDMTAIVVCESVTDVKRKDTDDSRRTSERSVDMISLKGTFNSVTCEGLDADNSRSNSDDVNYSPSKCVDFLATDTFIEDDKSVLNADSENQNDGTFLTGSTTAMCQGESQLAELFPKDEGCNLSNKGSKRVITENSCKSDDPTNSVGKTGSTTNDRHDSDVSQHNHVRMSDGDGLTRFQEEGYDSPFEDGELRGSFLYSWEENDLENECVDYESDGRNGDGSDGGDYPGSEVVEDVSEGSQAVGRRSLLIKRFSPGNGSKIGSFKHSSRSPFINDDSNDNGIAGKGESNAGSGTTVEQSLEMVIEENGTKRRNSTDVRDSVDGKFALRDEYVSKMGKGKLQSRIGGRSSMDATDGNGVFFMQQCRSRRPGGSYSRSERDVSPDKYMGRFRPATNNSRRDGADQWTQWGPKRSSYSTSSSVGPEGHGHTRPRNITDDSPDKYGGMDYHKPRQNANYMSKGFHKPFVRRSPMDQDDSFGARRRIPPTRGVSSCRSRGYYSQRSSGRDFGEDFDSRPDKFIPKRDRNFSPNSGRGAHMPLPRRRSRSRSRTRSPRAWGPPRERNMGSRRFSRSPDFRPDVRMDRIRAPFSKPNFASDFEEGAYNARWGDDRNFGENHLRRRSPPPGRVFRRNQNSDENFRPAFRRGPFSFMGKESKFELNYDNDRRRGDEMMHRRPHSGDGGNFRRLRHNDDFQTSSLNSNMNDEDNVQGVDPREMPKIDLEEDKRVFKV